MRHRTRGDGASPVSRRERRCGRPRLYGKNTYLGLNQSMRRSMLVLSLVSVISVSVFTHSILAHAQTVKPKLTLDEFFNSVSFPSVKVSPDGNSVVIETEKADWEQQIFRKELWLYRTASGSLTQLTQSGHDSSPEWSPDGQWIAFLSERKVVAAKDADAGDSKDGDNKDKDKDVAQLFLISPSGGEAFAITSGEDEVHAFAWSQDSKAIYFATRQPWTKQQNDDHKKQWKDVIRYRGAERGDVIFRITLNEAPALHAALGSNSRPLSDAEKDSGATPGAVAIARTPLRVGQISISHDSARLAFATSSVSERQEKVEDIELYLVSLTGSVGEATPVRLTHNEAVELNLEWAPDNRHLFFQVNLGSLERKYEDPQPRLYWIDAADTPGSTSANMANKREVQRWFAGYPGEVVRYTPLPDGSVL